MKSSPLFRHLLVLLCAVVFSGIVNIASAQSAETNPLEWQQIAIKNIRPSMLAYWLDPVHQVKPVEYQEAQDYLRLFQPPKQLGTPVETVSSESSSNGVLKMPNGVSTIFADDANNVIWVRSTSDGFDQLKQIVEFLDRPIRKIDFDIKMIEVNSVDASTVQSDPMLKVLFGPADPRGYHYFVNEENAQSLLSDWIKNGKATLIKASQLVIRNNLTDRFTTATSSPVIIDIKQANGGDEILDTQSDSDNSLLMEKRLSLVITPTINNDDTITIFFTGGVNAGLKHQNARADEKSLWVQRLDNTKGITSVCTLKNGDSMFFTGYNSTMLGLDNQNHPVVLWIKAEIEK